jgi:hypothetical protein
MENDWPSKPIQASSNLVARSKFKNQRCAVGKLASREPHKLETGRSNRPRATIKEGPVELTLRAPETGHKDWVDLGTRHRET